MRVAYRREGYPLGPPYSVDPVQGVSVHDSIRSAEPDHPDF